VSEAGSRESVRISRSADIPALEPEWNVLCDALDASPFVRPGWVSAWWDAFGTGEPTVLDARRDGRLVGLLPLERAGSVLRAPANWHTPSFAIIAEDREVEASLAEAAVAQDARRLSIGFLDATESTLHAFEAAAGAASRRLLVRELQRSPVLQLGSDGWEAFRQRISKNLAADVRRRTRKLEQEGALTIETGDGGDRLHELLVEGFRIEGSGWKNTEGTAIESQDETLLFYERVARWAASRGWLSLSFLRLDGRPLAFQLGLESGSAYYYLKGGYDPSFARFSPGKVLHHAMIERCVRAGLERYEFLGDAEPYKLQWADETHRIVLLQAFARSTPGTIDWASQAYGRPVARRCVIALRRLRRRAAETGRRATGGGAER
jgi:CelD/BcsL family acetyltransferase involved in cellulose biosynthesis